MPSVERRINNSNNIDELRHWLTLIQDKLTLLETNNRIYEELSEAHRDKILEDIHYNGYALSVYKVDIDNVFRKEFYTDEPQSNGLLKYLLWYPSDEDIGNAIHDEEDGSYIIVYYYLPESNFEPGPVKVYEDYLYRVVVDGLIEPDGDTVILNYSDGRIQNINVNVLKTDNDYTLVPDIPIPSEFRATKAYRG